MRHVRAFSGKVDTGFPQKMRPAREARARFRFNLIETRFSEALEDMPCDIEQAAAEVASYGLRAG